MAAEGDLDSGDVAERLWGRWKLAHQSIRMAVVADVTDVDRIPEPELSVLIQLASADGRLRQNAIAAATGWDRARLSHLLTRMEERDLVTRHKLTNGAEIRLTDGGAAVLDSARPALRSAVRKQFFDRLGNEDVAALDAILHKLLEH